MNSLQPSTFLNVPPLLSIKIAAIMIPAPLIRILLLSSQIAALSADCKACFLSDLGCQFKLSGNHVMESHIIPTTYIRSPLTCVSLAGWISGHPTATSA